MNRPLFTELSVTAQTTYAELLEQTRVFEMTKLAGLKGTFGRRVIRGHEYVYFSYKDVSRVLRMVYIGPTDNRVNALVEQFEQVKNPKQLAPLAQAAIALGCSAAVPKHFRIVKQLGNYGFYQAGGVLIGTHAFVAMGNMLGVRWTEGSQTLDVDFAHAGNNISLALPASLKMSVHDALTSLEMGLLPINQFGGGVGGQYRNPQDPELRLDFVTARGRNDDPVIMKDLGLTLQPLRFMEFSLEGTTQALVLSREGAVIVNIPAPERYAVHKLIVHGLRPREERTKATKDIIQAAALAQWHITNGVEEQFSVAWADAMQRGPNWKKNAKAGRTALLKRYPELDEPRLWAA